jgi:type II secretory ATPase GspE/PulE/Tfp pilus assembly ATPase PilB-like protein
VNKTTDFLLEKDHLPTLVAEKALYPVTKWQSELVGKSEGIQGTNQILFSIYNQIDEARWLKEMTVFLLCRTERLRGLSRGVGEAIAEFAYIPTPGLKNGTRIRHPCEGSKRGNTQAILAEAPGMRSRELAWLIPYKTSVRENNLIFILTFDPILEVTVRTVHRQWDEATTYWRAAAMERELLRGTTNTTCLHAFTGLHEWMNIIATKDGEETPEMWRRHKVSPEERAFATAAGLDIYYSNSVVTHAWSTLEKQKGRERARATLQQELCKRVVLFDPIYGNSPGIRTKYEEKPPSFLDPGETETERTAKSFWDTTSITAHERGASDIHIEPVLTAGRKSGDLIVSLRKDGQLNFHNRIPAELAGDFIRFALETSEIIREENRRPQDGRRGWINPRTGEGIDMRISVTPVGANHQKIVMRLLDTGKLKRGIADLNLEPGEVQLWEKALQLNQSLVLVSGPTNSGKSTTLYAAMLSIYQRDNHRSFSTIEDPVEYRLPFRSTQWPVNEDRGVTYESLIRQAMRNDGDTFLIGEIRDKPTASAAIQLALTGHQVLSSIHANSACETTLRLLELGVDPHLLSETLRLVVAQRLIPTPCPLCTHNVPERDVKGLLRRHGGEILLQTCGPKWERHYRKKPAWILGEGCPQCNFTGLSGMVAAQEFLPIDRKNKKLLKEGDMEGLANSMVERSMPTLEEVAWRMAWLGQIPLDQAGELTDQLKNY